MHGDTQSKKKKLAAVRICCGRKRNKRGKKLIRSECELKQWRGEEARDKKKLFNFWMNERRKKKLYSFVSSHS